MGCCTPIKPQTDECEVTNQTRTNIHMSIKSDIISLDEKKTNKIIQIYYLQNKVLISDFEKKKNV